MSTDLQVGDSWGKGSDLLQTLGDRVHNAISPAEPKMEMVSPAEVKDYIAGISGQPMPGMQVSCCL